MLTTGIALSSYNCRKASYMVALMLLSRSANVVLLILFALLFLPALSSASTQTSMKQSAEETAPHDTRPANCRVTLPADGVFEPPSSILLTPSRTPDRFFFGTEELWTVLPSDGTWRGHASSKAGDFVYDDKFQWFGTRAFTPQDGPLTISGKRLDGPAPSFIETFDAYSFAPKNGYAMVMTMISIPAFGCWHITGHHKDQDVTFTVWVTTRSEKELSGSSSSSAISAETPPPSPVVPRIHVDSETQTKELFYRVLPEVPPGAQAADISGTVVLHAIIGTDGRAHDVRYISGPEVLAQAAIDAVLWSQYRVATRSVDPYEPEEVDTTIPVLFPPR